MSRYYQPVPNVGIAWMAGWIGPILAVRLLGRASIYLMAPVSQAFQLAWTNRTMSLARGQMGSLCVARIRSRVSGEAVGASLAPQDDFRGRKLEAVAASAASPVIALLMFFAALWLGWSFTPMSRDVRIASMCWSAGYWSGCPARCAD
jgi:hypothetical protein